MKNSGQEQTVISTGNGDITGEVNDVVDGLALEQSTESEDVFDLPNDTAASSIIRNDFIDDAPDLYDMHREELLEVAWEEHEQRIQHIRQALADIAVETYHLKLGDEYTFESVLDAMGFETCNEFIHTLAENIEYGCQISGVELEQNFVF